jgi:hypothetical protein
MASLHVLSIVQGRVSDARAALVDVQGMLEGAKAHESDVVVGRYTIHRTEEGTLRVQCGNGAFERISEDLLATCIGMAYTKIKEAKEK